MTIRTFKQVGQGYGTTPVTITALIDNQVVYDGEVNTNPSVAPLPGEYSQVTDSDLFTWTDDLLFDGTRQFEIRVHNGDLLLKGRYADYASVVNPNPDSPPISSGPANFGMFYTTVENGILIYETLFDVKIDGGSMTTTPSAELNGQWYWLLTKNSVLTGTLRILPGILSPTL
jgi:hypothetical protein